ncbi:MAG TPA: hypothetical protein VF657_24560 [Actinoplanes sp.]
MSPGTSSGAGTSMTAPSRTTRAAGTCILARASTLARAASSCLAPSTTFSRMSSPTITAVANSPMTIPAATTISSMMFIGSRSCCAATAQDDGGFSSTMRLGPYRRSRSDAALPSNPRSASMSRPDSTSDAGRACHGGRPAAVPDRCWSIMLVASVIVRPLDAGR